MSVEDGEEAATDGAGNRPERSLRRGPHVEHALARARFQETSGLHEQSSLALWWLSWLRGEASQANQEPTTCPAASRLLWHGTWRWTLLGWEAVAHRGIAGGGCQEGPDLREDVATARAEEAVGTDWRESPW